VWKAHDFLANGGIVNKYPIKNLNTRTSLSNFLLTCAEVVLSLMQTLRFVREQPETSFKSHGKE
jgi:hypothetical protein